MEFIPCAECRKKGPLAGTVGGEPPASLCPSCRNNLKLIWQLRKKDRNVAKKAEAGNG